MNKTDSPLSEAVITESWFFPRVGPYGIFSIHIDRHISCCHCAILLWVITVLRVNEYIFHYSVLGTLASSGHPSLLILTTCPS